MIDRSWMLNPQAIRTAKECINAVKNELGIKLTLSHPDFMELLHEYVNLTDSEPLAEAYSKLLSMAGVGNVIRGLKKPETESNKVVPISDDIPVLKSVVGGDVVANSDELVEFNGRSYPRWLNGAEFKGMYRGQPRYS